MGRRLDLAASLMNRPALLILDEPTTGLDGASGVELWAALRELREAGTTMLLTTQYLEEADRFADAVHVLDHGVIIAAGTAADLKARAGTQVVDVLLAGQAAAAAAASLRASVAPPDLRAAEASRRLAIVAANGLHPPPRTAR